MPFLSFLSLTLSKGLFTSNLLSKTVGLISRFLEIGFSRKWKNIGLCPLIIDLDDSIIGLILWVVWLSSDGVDVVFDLFHMLIVREDMGSHLILTYKGLQLLTP